MNEISDFSNVPEVEGWEGESKWETALAVFFLVLFIVVLFTGVVIFGA